MCAITLRVCMQAYAKLRTDTPELLDLVAQFGGQDLTDDPMAVDGESSAPVANSGEFVSSKNNKIHNDINNNCNDHNKHNDSNNKNNKNNNNDDNTSTFQLMMSYVKLW